MKPIKMFAAMVPLSLLLGCSNPADNVPAADVKSATNSSTDVAKAPEPASRYFAFSGDSSAIGFTGSKVTGKHDGGFRKFVGEFTIVDGRLADTGNRIVIDMNSIWSDNNRVTSHLKTPDFFNVAQIPTATFVSTAIEEKGTNWTVTGDLTLHGVTKQISFPANIRVEDTAVTVNAQFFLNRNDFDIKYTGKANDLVRKEVVMRLNVKAAPGRAEFAAIEKPAAAGQ